MCQCLRGRDVAKLLARPAAEGTARRGQDEGVHRRGIAALQALEARRVLAVEGEQQPSPAPPRLERELPRRHEALLVREREVDPALERPERRGKAGEADDGVQDEVGLSALEQLGEVAADLGQRRQPVDRLGAGRDGHELELRMCLDDLERLPADRAGGAEERDPPHCEKSTARNSSRTRLNSSGCSSAMTCAALWTTASRASGSSRASRSAIVLKSGTSSSPTTSSVGT